MDLSLETSQDSSQDSLDLSLPLIGNEKSNDKYVENIDETQNVNLKEIENGAAEISNALLLTKRYGDGQCRCKEKDLVCFINY